MASNLIEILMQAKMLGSGTSDFTSSLYPVVYRLSISLGLLSSVFPDFILYSTYSGGLY